MVKRIVFMGSSDLGIETIHRLMQSSDYEVIALYTQPAKPAFRGLRTLKMSPIQVLGIQYNLPTFCPSSLKNDSSVGQQIAGFNPDFILVIAYGQILPGHILKLAKIAAINVHGSLLPLWRGATPIETAIINNSGIGLTTMLMNSELDAGDILLQQPLKLDFHQYPTIVDFKNSLSFQTADLVLKTLDNFAQISPQSQNLSQGTWAYKFSAVDYKINWSEPADLIQRKIYALAKMYTYYHNQQLKIISAQALTITEKKIVGTILNLLPLTIQCGNNTVLSIQKLQRPGAKVLTVRDFLLGYKLSIGAVLT